MVGFDVYDDFMNYSTGIYDLDPTSAYAGGHAVILVGWNVDANNRLYWIAQNQWGSDWGMNGFFNIYAGNCGIDIFAISCAADFTQ